MQKKRTFKKKRPGSKFGFRRKKVCKFCVDKTDTINYKEVDRLNRFITERGKILPSRISGTCAHHQRTLARAIRRARSIALVPYIANYR
jgi:small subunit ribosomal protein S18